MQLKASCSKPTTYLSSALQTGGRRPLINTAVFSDKQSLCALWCWLCSQNMWDSVCLWKIIYFAVLNTHAFYIFNNEKNYY